VIDVGKRGVAGAPEPQGLLVFAEAIGADARAAERVAGAPTVADGVEAYVRFGVEADSLGVVAFGILQESELAQCEGEHQRLAPLVCDLVTRLERRPRRSELVL
jgi:hypothetical protein